MPYPRVKPELITKYLDSLTEHERSAMKIAADQLGSSFDVEKSIGFTQWLSSLNEK